MSVLEQPIAAGRELDTLIAERVMGWQREGQPKDINGDFEGEPVLMPPDTSFASMARAGWYPPPRGRLALGYFAYEFSTNLYHAESVVRTLSARGWTVDFSYQNTAQGWQWRVALWHEATGTPEDQFSTSLPLAICRAALAALAPVPAPAGEPSRAHD